jgi:hypothetical protein
MNESKEAKIVKVAVCICDYPQDQHLTVAQMAAVKGHRNQAGGNCCPHHGNTCGFCHQYDKRD